MPETQPPLSPELINGVWHDVLIARHSFNEIKSIDEQLARGNPDNENRAPLVAKRTELEHDFAIAAARAGVVMREPGNPFDVRTEQPIRRSLDRVPEGIIDLESPICTEEELKSLAAWRGRNPSIAIVSFNVIGRQATSPLKNFATITKNITDPASKQPAEIDESEPVPLVVYTGRGGQVVAFDKANLRHHVSQWLVENPRIPYLGPDRIDFLADYCNQAFPNLKPLQLRSES